MTMTKLSDFKRIIHSQFGEDGMIEEIFRRIQPHHETCVEFGAGNGLALSNTVHLRRSLGWSALLIEADDDLATEARHNTRHEKATTVLHAKITPTGTSSIDSILEVMNIEQVDFMSIDVDGDDYWIFTNMECRPRVLCIEFNPTIPPHLALQPLPPGNRYGVAPLTLWHAARTKNYTMVGIIGPNMFFVRDEEAHPFSDLETSLEALLPPETFTYLSTDYDGNVHPIGATPPWGFVWPS